MYIHIYMILILINYYYYFIDEFGLIYVLICTQYYPQRVAHACLVELQSEVNIYLFNYKVAFQI